MSSHQYAIGDIVCFQSRSPVKLPDSFEITARLPHRDGVLQYRIKSEDERHERVVQEDDIELIHGDGSSQDNTPAHLRGSVASNSSERKLLS